MRTILYENISHDSSKNKNIVIMKNYIKFLEINYG